MGTITINGKTYSGNNISIINGTVIVDGNGIENLKQDQITINLTGSFENFQCDRALRVNGNIESYYIKVGGAVACDEIKGNIEVGGSVACDDIHGDVKVGGSLSASKIYGSIKK